MIIKKIFLFILFFLSIYSVSFAQETVTYTKIRTGIYINPPFVMKDSSGYFTGMAIDLWELLEDEMNFTAEYIEYPSWTAMMSDVASGKIDAAVSNISVTYERAKHVKFSFPWFDSGLRIMVKTSGQGNTWTELKRNGHLQAYIWIISFIVLLTIILTFIHRKQDPRFPRNWLDGLAESLYRLVVALKTGEVNNKNYSWFGKVLAVTWMFTGVGLVAYVTSSVTSSMTAVALTNDINSFSDLPGKRVGVLTGTIAEEYMKNHGIATIGYQNMGEASDALLSDQIDAVVEDTPVLEYWVFLNPQYKMKVVGNIFHPDKYAFAANKKYSAQMDSLSIKLIKLFEIEKVNNLKNSYFGRVH